MATGRGPGGASYHGDSSSASPAAANACILLDDLNTSAADDAYAKHGCFHVTTSGTTVVLIDLTNLATHATTYAGDVTFAKVNKLVAYNLSGVDGVAAADMTLGATAATPANFWGVLVATPITVPASSRIVLESTTGLTVDSTHKQISLTPSAGGNFALVVCGS